MSLKSLAIVCGAFLLGIIVMSVLMVGRLNRERPFAPEMTGMPGFPPSGTPGVSGPFPGPGGSMPPGVFMHYNCKAISTTNGVFVFSLGKLVKMSKNSLEQIGEIKLPQGYIVDEVKTFDVVRNADGTERILVCHLSKMLVVDAKSFKLIRTIALPAVPSPGMGMQQGGMPGIGASPYSFVDESVATNSDVVYVLCGFRIAAVNFESGKIIATQDTSVPGAP